MPLSPDQLSQATILGDFDSALVTIESLDAFAEYVLADAPNRSEVLAELGALTARGMNGEIPFDASLEARLNLLDAHYCDVVRFGEQMVEHISPSAARNRDWFVANAHRFHILSGGFEPFIRPVAAELGLLADNIHGNAFIYDGPDGRVIGHDTARATAQAGGKAAKAKELGIEGPTVAVGDGYTDLEIRLHGAADECWAITETIERPRVVAGADRIVADYGEVISLASGEV